MNGKDDDRFARQTSIFGMEGQERIAAANVAVVGIGGLGTHVVQQLAYLGVRNFTLVDDEELETSNLNRYIGSRYDDRIPGTRKVDSGEQLIRSVSPDADVRRIFDTAMSEAAFSELETSDAVFGCVDNEGTRLVINELASAYNRPYFDLASEIHPGKDLTYGGRVVSTVSRPGCIACLGELDLEEAALDLACADRRSERDRLYGVDSSGLEGAGPSVVSINGVIASLAVTEFMAFITGLRKPIRLLRYRGDTGKVTSSSDQPTDCFTCSVSGMAERANVERYLARRDQS